MGGGLLLLVLFGRSYARRRLPPTICGAAMLAMLHASAALHASARPALQLMRHRHVQLRYQSEDERREALEQLFGKRTAQARAPKRESAVPEVQMLQAGLQKLEWGGVRLVDVELAAGEPRPGI
jgi:hypothetical protein